MKINYTIYNINDTRNCFYSFMSWDCAEGYFNFDDYKKVWNGEYDTKIFDGKIFSIENVLGRLFEMFNLHHSKGYKGHSMSVSDVVELKIDNFTLGKYYCDSYGWVKISN